MKKVVISVIVIAALVGGYQFLSTRQVDLSILRGQLVDVHRGDLTVPITASGNIEAASITNIKGEASGEVVEIPYDIGAMVKKGDLIIRLDETDERRTVDRSEADYQRARIAREQAEISLRKQREAVVPQAEAKLAQAVARRNLAELSFKHQEALLKLNQSERGIDPLVQREYDDAQAQFDEAVAVEKASKAELVLAHIGVEMATKEVETAGESLKTAKKTLEDAQERLSETKVYSPINGMVLTRHVQVGEVVQSGKTSLTGGTVLVELANVDKIYAVVNVDEADIGQVRELAPPSARPGPTATRPVELPEGTIDTSQEVEVTVESFPNEKFTGIIERISPQSEMVRGIATFKVWIHINSDNRDKLVGLLNTQAEARFTVNSIKDAILVSYDAIKPNPNGEGSGVYIPDPPNPKPKFIKCEFGAENGIDIQVKSGLTDGQKVYTKLPQQTEREKKAQEEKEGL